MEKTTSSSLGTSREIRVMAEGLEFIFNSMICQGDISNAIDFIKAIDTNYIPSKTMIQKLIFQVLMKFDDVRCLTKTGAYLISVLEVYPPCDAERREFYYDAIRDSQGFLADLWNVFCHIVNSYFCYQGIYVMDGCGPDVINYPNCNFLLNFYLKLFAVEYEYVTPESFNLKLDSVTKKAINTYESCLFMHLLWPGGEIARSSRCENLFKWINDIYSGFDGQRANLLKSMHKLLNLMVKCIIHRKHNLVDVAAFNDPCLASIVEDVTNFCKNAFSSLSNVKLFLSSLSVKCLQARVSEKIIRTITKQNNKPFGILTLKEIVNQHMFPSKYNKWKNIKTTTCKEKKLRKRTSDKSVGKTSKMETTKLHQLCKENKFADLIEALKTSYNRINTRDFSGCTPLHVACQAGKYLCVKGLIDEAGRAPVPKLDFTIADNEGFTPLHIVVTSNNVSIARLLLESGGSDLLNATDNNNQRPSDLECSEEMGKLLQKYQKQTRVKELDSFIENSQIKEAPMLKSFKEYSIYLHALNYLLCSYANLFQLYNLAWKKTTFTQSHTEKMCCHFVNDNFACSEDAVLLSELPSLIETFIQSLHSNASKSNFNIDLELLPLKAFKSSIQMT